MYKDKDKQREAIKEATRRYRAKNEDSALSGQKRVSQNARGLPVLDVASDTLPVIPKIKTKGVTVKSMTKAVGVTGGEYSFKTVKGEIQDVHRTLPACVPEPVRSRYAKGEPEYIQTIDRLLAHTIDQLKAEAVWIPVWRYTAGQTIV